MKASEDSAEDHKTYFRKGPATFGAASAVLVLTRPLATAPCGTEEHYHATHEPAPDAVFPADESQRGDHHSKRQDVVSAVPDARLSENVAARPMPRSFAASMRLGMASTT